MNDTDTPLAEQVRIQHELNKAESREEVLGLALGAASVSWSESPRGVFQSDDVLRIQRAALNRMEELELAAIGPVGEVLHEIGLERARQMQLGYTTDHDDQHGEEHLLAWAAHYLMQSGDRQNMVAAAALIVAAIEHRDRNAPPVVTIHAQSPREAEEAAHRAVMGLDR